MDSYDKAYNSWDEMTPSERKSWCESFTICCRLNLSGSQENKLMNMQQE